MPAADLRPGARGSRRLVHRMASRVGGRVALFDARGRVIADSDPDGPATAPPATSVRLAAAGFTRDGDVHQAVHDATAVVVARAHTRAGPRTLVLRRSLDDARAADAVVRSALPVAGGVGLAVAAALGAAVGFGLLRRLEGLRRGARRLAEHRIEEPPDARGAGGGEGRRPRGPPGSMRAPPQGQEPG